MAVAFLLVASCFHLPAARGPGRDRLRQARHLAAAAAAAGAVAAEAADHERPAFFLVGRALHPHVLHQPEAAYLLTKSRRLHRRQVARVQLRPEAAACRTADAQSSLVTLRRILSCPTMRGIWLLTWSSRWLATMFLLLRRRTLES